MDTHSTLIRWDGGLLESQEPSVLNNLVKGFATELVNLVPEPTGGLRARAKWFQGSVTGLPSTRKCVGAGMFSRFTDPTVVQVSAPTKTKIVTNGPALTPIVSWSQPTTLGNTLLCIVAIEIGAANTGNTFTSAWGSIRVAPTLTAETEYIGVVEIANAPVQSGDQTPFTFHNDNGQPTGIIAWLVELSGVSSAPFDQTGTGHAVGANSSSASLNAPTAQSSEIVIAIDSSKKPNPSGTDSASYTLSTGSAGWSELVEAGQLHTDAFAQPVWQEAAIYTSARQSIGVSTINVASSVAVNHSVRLLSYKGWNTSAVVDPITTNWLAANDNGTSIDIWSIRKDSLASGTWTNVAPAVAANGGSPVAFARGLGGAWWTGTKFSGVQFFDGLTATTIVGSPVGARCIASWLDRLWLGGIPAFPHRLYYSQAADGKTWETNATTDAAKRGVGHWDFGTDDGEAIEDITPFLDGLVVGKRTSLWLLAGSGPANFQRIQLNAGGAAPGRSVLTTPFGCVIAGREMVWLYDGQTVTPIGRAIERSYRVAEGSWVTMSYIDGSIYIAVGELAKKFVFDLNQGSWRIEQIGDTAGEAAAIVYNYGDTQLYGPVSAGVGSLLNYRTFPGAARGKDTAALAMVYAASTGDLWLAGPRNRATPKELWLQTRQRDGGPGQARLKIDVTYDDAQADDPRFIEARDPARVYRDPVPLGTNKGISSMKLRYSAAVPATDTIAYDIEATQLDFERHEAS